jgi:hypothetical protein
MDKWTLLHAVVGALCFAKSRASWFCKLGSVVLEWVATLGRFMFSIHLNPKFFSKIPAQTFIRLAHIAHLSCKWLRIRIYRL